eukprot:gene8316-8501_t
MPALKGQEQQLAAQATSAKARNDSILQKLAAAGKCDVAGAAAVEVQLIALRGAYLTLVERSFPDWQQQALQHVQQQPDMQQRGGGISHFEGGALQAAAALSNTTRSNGWQAPMPASPQGSTGALSDPQQPLQQQRRQQQKLVDSQAAIDSRGPQSYIIADPNSCKHAVNPTAESVISTGVSLGRSSSSAAAAALQKLAEAAAVLRAKYYKAGELVESGALESAATVTALAPAATPPAAHAAEFIQHHLASQHAMQQPQLQQEQQKHSQQHPKQPPRQQAVSDGSPKQAPIQQATHSQMYDGDQLAAVLPEQVAAAAAAVADYNDNDSDGAVSAVVTEQQHWVLPAAAAVPAQRGEYKIQGTHGTDEVQHMERGGSSAALPNPSLPLEAETEQLTQQLQQQMEEQPGQHRTAQQVYMQLKQHDSQPCITAPEQEGGVKHLPSAAAAHAENSAGVEAEAALSAAAPTSHYLEKLPGTMLSAVAPAVLTGQVFYDADIRGGDGTTVVSVSVTGVRVSAKDEKAAAIASDEEIGGTSSHTTGSFEVTTSMAQVGPAAAEEEDEDDEEEEEEIEEGEDEDEIEGRGGGRADTNGQGSKGTADRTYDADVDPGLDAQDADPGLKADAAVIAVATLASSISAENATEHEGSLTKSSITVASSLRPTPASAPGSTGSWNPPSGQPLTTPQTNLGLSSLAVELGSSSIDAGVVSNHGSSTTAVVIGMVSAGNGNMGAAAGVQVAGTGDRGPLGYDAGMLLSPATRLSLGAASVGDASTDGRPSLSPESDFGSSRRQSLKAAAAGGGGLGSVNLQPLLKVPSIAVPGSDTLASSPAASSSCRTTAVVHDGIEAAAVDQRQGMQQRGQQTTAYGATSSIKPLPHLSTSVGSPHRQRQQQAGRTDVLEQAAATPRHHHFQPDQTPPVQCRQLLHEVKLMEKILNTGLTDFAGSDSEEEGEYGFAGNAEAAAPARPPTLPPDSADGGTRDGGASNAILLQKPGSMQRAAADNSSMQDDDFDF